MVDPSGCTSTDIQVPSLVVNWMMRSGSRGSSLVAFLVESFLVSSCACRVNMEIRKRAVEKKSRFI